MMNRYLLTALAATSCMIGNTPASAAIVVPITSDTFSYGYAAGTNTIDFTFTLPKSGTIVLTVSTDSFGDDFTFDAVNFAVGTVNTYQLGATQGIYLGAVIPDPIAGGVSNTLSVEYTSDEAGTFFGNYAFSAVPEPATWAMMLAGMGMIGLAVRRRQTQQVTYA